jgi:hypothetical protein
MLGGINNGLFFQGFGGFLVLLIVLVPLLIWTFPRNRKDAEQNKTARQIKKELRKLKRK